MTPIAARLRSTVAALLAFLLAGPAGLGAQEGRPAEGPRLGVLLVVDQLRGDLLDRYDDLFVGGFRRLLDEGRVFTAATHDHLVTETAAGHATLATGTTPARNGVVGNHWYERQGGEWLGVENVVDRESSVLGQPSLPGASPGVLLRDGVADWLRDADGDSRVVSVGGKARGAVLLGGRSGGTPVVWFEARAGRFVTSGWYGDDEPAWLTTFNTRELPDFATDSVWESTVPAPAAPRSRPDSVPYESDGQRTFFPHRYEEEQAAVPRLSFWSWFATTPELDRATLRLARRAVVAEGLGEDDAVDLLAVSLSQTDRVGHGYGPLSREQLDNLLRLDRVLGDFFSFLDRTVGKGGWTLAFSSDHGAQTAPEWERTEGREGGYRLTSDSLASLQAAVHRAAREAGGDPRKLAGPLAAEVVALTWVARVWTHDQLERGEPADSFEALARASHRPDRPIGLLGRFGVQFMLEPGVVPFGYDTAGSTHQSGYHHDRHVPFVLLGVGVEGGVKETSEVSAVDMAPTLAALLGIPVPDDLDGVVRGGGRP